MNDSGQVAFCRSRQNRQCKIIVAPKRFAGPNSARTRPLEAATIGKLSRTFRNSRGPFACPHGETPRRDGAPVNLLRAQSTFGLCGAHIAYRPRRLRKVDCLPREAALARKRNGLLAAINRSALVRRRPMTARAAIFVGLPGRALNPVTKSTSGIAEASLPGQARCGRSS